VPFELNTPATSSMLSAMKQYENYKGTVPDYGQIEGWISADLMITGLEHAGANPTRASFMTGLRSVDNYSANGLLANPVDLRLSAFGTAAQQTCAYIVQLVNGRFLPLPKVCGTRLSS
jgi:branched-chain amino acid transport system substrate-binding protein